MLQEADDSEHEHDERDIEDERDDEGELVLTTDSDIDVPSVPNGLETGDDSGSGSSVL